MPPVSRCKFLAIGLLLLFAVYRTTAQDTARVSSCFRCIQNSQSDLNYMALLPVVENFSGDRPWVEAACGSRFYLVTSLKYRLLIDVAAQVQLRVFNEMSYPVWSPGYMPSASVLWLWRSSYVKLQAGHVSNGETGNFYNHDSTSVNFRNGSFCTNYLQLQYGIIFNCMNHGFHHAALAFRFDGDLLLPVFEYERVFKYSYGQYRFVFQYNWNSGEKLIRLGFEDLSLPVSFTFRTENSYIAGRLSDYPDIYDPRKFRFSHMSRLAVNIGKPLSVSPFVQYFYGRDYYNIRYAERISALLLGISIKKTF